MRSLVQAFVALVLLTSPLDAMAQASGAAAHDDLRAQASFRAGTAYYEAGDYESALGEFQTAYDLSQRPELLWNLYLCHERLAQWEDAASSLDAFLQAGSPGYPREQVEARLAHLRERIARRGSGAPDDDTTEAETADPGPLAPAGPPPPVDTTPVVAIVGFSIAAVGLVGFGVLGALTLSEDAALTNECGTHCTASRASMLDVYALGTDISAGVALAGAIVGVVGLVLAPSAPAAASARVVPSFGPSHASLTITGVF